jgi:hypothetical protein
MVRKLWYSYSYLLVGAALAELTIDLSIYYNK